MAYTALKPCKFAGQSFRVGEPVPEILLVPGALPGLVKMGVLASTEAEPVPSSPAGTLDITVLVEEGGLPLTLTRQGLEDAVRALTASAAEAEQVIGGMTDPDALILVDLLAGRKALRDAARARARKLEAGEGK